jgi:hypothetical protein
MAKKKTNTLLWVGGGVAVAGGLGYWWWSRPRWLVLKHKNLSVDVWFSFPDYGSANAAKKQAEEWGATARIEMRRGEAPEGVIVSNEWVADDVKFFLTAGIGNAPAQVQDWGKRGMHLGPYHESSTHGDSPFLFGNHDGHYHQITMPDGTPWRTHKDYLTGLGKVERMHAEAWKEGRKSWVDITPQGGPKMRVTHQIFGGERGAGY